MSNIAKLSAEMSRLDYVFQPSAMRTGKCNVRLRRKEPVLDHGSFICDQHKLQFLDPDGQLTNENFGVPVDPPQSRSAPGRSAPCPTQVRSFRPRCWVVLPQLLGRFAPMLCRPKLTPVPYSIGGWWGLKHKN